MPETTPPAIRSVITDDEFGGFRITIPGTEGGRCALGCGLALWAVVLARALLFVASDPDRNLSGGARFLGVWAAIGLALGFGTARAFTFHEIVVIDGKTLLLRREMAGYSGGLTFDLAGVRNLRPEGTGGPGRPTPVAFDHGGLTYRFGVGLSEHEVVRLVKTIRSRFPIRDHWSDAEPLPIATWTGGSRGRLDKRGGLAEINKG